ncbi:Intracellular ribonuclease LX, partial [Linum perenne]
CKQPVEAELTIHCLWPSNQYPPNPTPTDPAWSSADLKANVTNSNVPTLTSIMETYWPNLYIGPTKWDFWTHEWNAHGLLCTGFTPVDYFQTTLDCFSAYDNPLDSMSTRGVVPSNANRYKADKIRSSAGDSPILACYPNPKSTSDYILYEIRFCFDPTTLARQPCDAPDPMGICGGPNGEVWFLEL